MLSIFKSPFDVSGVVLDWNGTADRMPKLIDQISVLQRKDIPVLIYTSEVAEAQEWFSQQKPTLHPLEFFSKSRDIEELLDANGPIANRLPGTKPIAFIDDSMHCYQDAQGFLRRVDYWLENGHKGIFNEKIPSNLLEWAKRLSIVQYRKSIGSTLFSSIKTALANRQFYLYNLPSIIGLISLALLQRSQKPEA